MPGRRSPAVAAAVAAAVVACGPPPAPSSEVTPNDAIVHIRTNVADADLYVDGRLVGRIGMLGRGGIAVEPGTHHLELRRDDYFSSYLEVQLARAEKKDVEMRLWAILP